MANQLVEITKNIFKDKVSKSALPAYIKMAEFITKTENIKKGSLVWTPDKCYEAYIEQNGTLGFEVVNGEVITDPTLKNWDDFLQEPKINDMLLTMVTSTKRPVLREKIYNISAQKDLTQGDLKALEALTKLLDKNEAEDNKVKYIQNVVPIAYDEDFNNEEIVKQFIIKEE